MTHRQSEPMTMLLFGLLAGAAGALLFAPRSGRETREKMKEMGRKWQDKAMTQKDDMVGKVKEGLDKVSSEVSNKADQASNKVESLRGRKRGNGLTRATPYSDGQEG